MQHKKTHQFQPETDSFARLYCQGWKKPSTAVYPPHPHPTPPHRFSSNLRQFGSNYSLLEEASWAGTEKLKKEDEAPLRRAQIQILKMSSHNKACKQHAKYMCFEFKRTFWHPNPSPSVTTNKLDGLVWSCSINGAESLPRRPRWIQPTLQVHLLPVGHVLFRNTLRSEREPL